MCIRDSARNSNQVTTEHTDRENAKNYQETTEGVNSTELRIRKQQLTKMSRPGSKFGCSTIVIIKYKV